MALKETQPKRGHLRGTSPNTKSDARGRQDGQRGQSESGYPHRMDSGKDEGGGSRQEGLTAGPAFHTGYRKRGEVPPEPRRAREGVGERLPRTDRPPVDNP